MANNQTITTIDVTVKAESLEDDLFSIYSKLFPETRKEDLVFQELKGGYVNSIQKVSTIKNPERSLVFRTFGLKLNPAEFVKKVAIKSEEQLKSFGDLKLTDQINSQSNGQSNGEEKSVQQAELAAFDVNVIFNRDTEFEVMNVISRAGLCKPLYAKYSNGLCYGFAEGVTVNGVLMLTNDFLNEMATKFARFHSIKHEIPNIKFRTHLERMKSQISPTIENMINIVKEYMDAHKNEFPYDKFPELTSLLVIEQRLMNLLQRIGLGDITWCHNDSNQKNLIWNPQNRTVSFIDFEMSMNDYAIFDIGRLFFYYTGHFLVDFDGELFPNADYRKRFLRKYLEEKNKLNGIVMTTDEFEAHLIKLFHQCNLTIMIIMSQMTIMVPFFDVNPNFFKNAELDLAKSTVKHYCGKHGYKIYELLAEIKDELIEDAEKYADTLAEE